MAVYVDDMRMPADVGRVSGIWSHMMADTVTELDAMARRIGMRTAWRQNKRSGVHYDLVESRRAAAVAAGAVELECGSDRWCEVVAVARTQFVDKADIVRRARAALSDDSLPVRVRQARQRPAGASGSGTG